MSEMVERVAEAIYGEMPYDELSGSKPPWVPKGNSLKQDEARRKARAAIKALMEPTDKMLEAGDDGYYGMSGGDVWQAMFTAALDETGD